MKKEKILLTGASGSMGSIAFKEIWEQRDKYDIVLLLLANKKNKKIFKEYEKEAGIKSIPGLGVVENNDKSFKIVWGDATNYDDVLETVNGVDWVLSPMALIAPEADHKPELAKAVNTGGIQNIVKAIKAQPNGREHIRLVTISSVAVYGDRLQKIHMVRAGDPIKPSIYDNYAITKIGGEIAVIESGIKHWAIIRQTYIAIPKLTSLLDPILFHQPIDTHIEAITNTDAGYGLSRCLCIPKDSDFWQNIYNMSGGHNFRIVYLDYIERMMKIFGAGDYKKIMERKWFALKNFHCCWYEDSRILNNYLGHQRQSYDDHVEQVKKTAPWYMKLGSNSIIQKIIPSKLVYYIMKRFTSGKDGTMHWVKNNNQGRITAFYGSIEKFNAMPDWDEDMPDMNPKPIRLNHGYDENKKILELEDLQSAAEFRGGKLLSSEWNREMSEKLKWQCAFNHKFTASPTYVLKAGHWCPECAAPPWDYDKIAKKNKFFAQAWYPNHNPDENNYYDKDCYEDIL